MPRPLFGQPSQSPSALSFTSIQSAYPQALRPSRVDHFGKNECRRFSFVPFRRYTCPAPAMRTGFQPLHHLDVACRVGAIPLDFAALCAPRCLFAARRSRRDEAPNKSGAWQTSLGAFAIVLLLRMWVRIKFLQLRPRPGRRSLTTVVHSRIPGHARAAACVFGTEHCAQ